MMKAYPEYKDSGVEWLGEIPAHWSLHSLKRAVGKCTNGIWGEEPDGKNDLVVLRVADFDRNALKIADDKLTKRAISLKERETRLLRKGDLLLEKSGGGEKTLVGCTVLFDKDYEAVTSNFVAKMTPLQGFDSAYLNYAFSHLYAGNVNYPSINQTTGIQNIDSESYLLNYFSFPPVAEQAGIAKYLDAETSRIDNLIAEKENFIKLLSEKRQALISHVVTKGLNPNIEIKEVPFTKYLSEQSDYRGKTPNKTDSGVLLVTARNIKMGFIDYECSKEYIAETDYNEVMRRGLPKFGDILFTTEAPLGNVALVNNENIALAQRVIRFRTNESYLNSEYTVLLMQSDYFQNQIKQLAQGITAQGIKASKLNQLKVYMPSIEEQSEIVQYVKDKNSRIDALVNETNKSIEFLKEHRTALISAAVTGKIDVREEV